MFKGTDIELAVLLALWCGLRMSEIRGLKLSDFKNGNLTVNRVIVDVGKESVVKDYAKTTDSHRQLQVPIQIQDLINKVNTEYIVPFSRKSIYQKFKRVVKKNGYNISFHDLRHPYVKLKLKILSAYFSRTFGAKVLDFPHDFNPVIGIYTHLFDKHIGKCLR